MIKIVLALLGFLFLFPVNPLRYYRVSIPLVFANPGVRGVVLWPGEAERLQAQMEQARPTWIKTGLQWYKIEAEKGIYLWPEAFDRDYEIMVQGGYQIMAILHDAPAWARTDPRACGRIDAEHIADFVEFASLAARRYPGITYWEIWNEPDDQYGFEDSFGCWGDPNEPYFGGGYYATVLNPVRAGIISVNPQAKVYIGGLMLPCLNCPQAQYLEGIVRAGGEFDGVSFHFYTWFLDGNVSPQPQVEYIRSLTDKPIMLSETSLLYDGTGEKYEEAQGKFVNFIYDEVRCLALQGFMWYALPDSGWHHSSLMEHLRQKPAFQTFASYDD